MPLVTPPLIIKIVAALACVPLVCLSAEAAERKAVVRVTTGSVQINNWQHNLVQGTPNLGHWHWNPIYANVQGLKTVRANSGPDRFHHRHGPSPIHPNMTVTQINPRPQSVYTRPNHIPFNLTRPPETNVSANWRAPSVSANLSHRDVNANLANRDLSGNLRNNQVNGTLANRDVSGTLSQNRTNARLADRNVSGELLPAAPQQLAPPAPPRVATYGQNYGGDDFARISQGRSNRVEQSTVYGRIATPKKNKAKKSTNGNINY
ncbi:hypothetical protein BH10CYA1_BH10CYA1_51270 [soil metagenome]